MEAAHKEQIKEEAKQSECREVRRTKSHRKPSPFTRKSDMSWSRYEDCRRSSMEKLSTAASGLTASNGSQSAHGAFRYCRALRALRVVIVPGCQHFGLRCSRMLLSNSNRRQCPDNLLAPQAELRPRVCVSRMEAGVVALCLPSDFHRIGTAACGSCQQLERWICPKRKSVKFWVQPLHTAHNYNNSAFPKTCEL